MFWCSNLKRKTTTVGTWLPNIQITEPFSWQTNESFLFNPSVTQPLTRKFNRHLVLISGLTEEAFRPNSREDRNLPSSLKLSIPIVGQFSAQTAQQISGTVKIWIPDWSGIQKVKLCSVEECGFLLLVSFLEAESMGRWSGVTQSMF